MQVRMCSAKFDTDAYTFASIPTSFTYCTVSNFPPPRVSQYLLFALLLQSTPLDADVKVTPQNLTLSLRPGKLYGQVQKISEPIS